MSIDIINEWDVFEKCNYCSRDLHIDKWDSEWSGHRHYKVNNCECGHSVRKEVTFSGSGHDEWHKDNKKESIHDVWPRRYT